MKPNATVLVSCLTLLLLSRGPTRAQEQIALPEGEGKALVSVICSQCHGIRPLFVYNGDDRKWEILVHEMIAFGAQVSPSERDTILAYLTTSFSSQRTAEAPNTARLPAGTGREVLQASCASCHGVALIAGKRADLAGWEAILSRHTAEERVKLSAEEAKVLLAYLVANFGPANETR